MKKEWIVRIKVLIISAVFVSIANFISTWKAGSVVYPWQAVPGLMLMFVMIILGCLLQDLFKYFKIQLPSILFISLITILASIPGFSPIAELVRVEFGKIGLLPLCTPILAYAGISIGKDLDAFKKQGIAIVCVALCTFLGTYVGSVLIAQIMLKVTGVI